MGKIEWAMWANEQAIISTGILFLGGILATLSLTEGFTHTKWQIGAYAMAFAVIMFIIEHPRSKRITGRTNQRSGQYCTSRIVMTLGFLGSNYFVRFLFYLLAAVPCLFQLGTVMGGLSVLVTSLIYFVAAVGGEKWVPCEKVVARAKTYTRAAPPTAAPPRLQGKTNKGQTSDEMYGNL